jgi:glucosylglycerate synthase
MLLDGAEPADLVVGVLTFNDKATAPGVARALAEGCVRSFPQRRVLMVNCDAGSQDETPQFVERGVGDGVRLRTIRHPVLGASFNIASESGVPGRETAVRILAAITDKLDATACLVVDGNLKSVDPTWTQLLADPILDKESIACCPGFNAIGTKGR